LFARPKNAELWFASKQSMRRVTEEPELGTTWRKSGFAKDLCSSFSCRSSPENRRKMGLTTELSDFCGRKL
jgi:hypothetical protein